MLITDAFAQAAAPPQGDFTSSILQQILFFGAIIAVFYFLLIRPQQKRLKAHQDMVAGVKRGDVIVTTGGLIGKVRSVAEDELRVELAPNVEVRIERGFVSTVRNRGEPVAANDAKPAKPDA